MGPGGGEGVGGQGTVGGLTYVEPLQAHLWDSQHPRRPYSCQQEQTEWGLLISLFLL